MIGNDVVDLALAAAESNWQRKGYLQKIFTENEQQIIFTAENPNVKVWELWSRKESVYKIFNRITGIKAYNPLRFECFNDSDLGIVCFGNTLYSTQTQTTENYVHTIATLNVKDLSKVIYLENRKEIHKKSGIPFLGQHPVSISNHGRFEKIVALQTQS